MTYTTAKTGAQIDAALADDISKTSVHVKGTAEHSDDDDLMRLELDSLTLQGNLFSLFAETGQRRLRAYIEDHPSTDGEHNVILRGHTGTGTGIGRNYLIFKPSDNEFAFIDGGIVVGSPTGGNKGAGTINAQAVYDDDVLLTDYVFDAYLDGDIDTKHYDNLVPDRQHDQDGIISIEQREHLPAQNFRNNMDELDPKEYAKKVRISRKLPAFERLGEGKPSLGSMNQALLETCEVLSIHIEKLEKRIEQLEKAQKETL